MSDIRHGTYGGYQRCCRRPEGSCASCRRASADYAAEYRRTHPVPRARERAKNNARTRALWRLAAIQPGLFLALYEDELGKDGAA